MSKRNRLISATFISIHIYLLYRASTAEVFRSVFELRAQCVVGYTDKLGGFYLLLESKIGSMKNGILFTGLKDDCRAFRVTFLPRTAG